MKKICLYSGSGVCRVSCSHLQTLLSQHFPVELIGPSELIEGSWMEDTLLLVFPGGADLPYCRALNGVGNQKISSFVQNGGQFLGVCAGSYYAGSFVEFAKGTDLEVVGKRELAFFPGTVQGPTFSPFQYASTVGARVVTLSTELLESQVTSFYQGGGHFCGESERVRVLARYAEVESEPAAVVLCSVGKGAALLSGVHFEYPLKKNNEARLQFIRKCFELLSLNV